MSFYEEFKRRNVAKVAVLYVIASWLLLQATDVLSSLLPVPDWAGSLVVMLLLLGFVPALIVSWVYEMTPEGLKRETDIDRSQSVPQQSGRKINVLIVALLALGIATVIVDRLIPEQADETLPVSLVDESPEPSPDDASADVPSIAVLPFENFSGNDADEYFSDGLSDTVLHQLAQVRDLKVIARNSTFQFKGTNLDVREIGERLGVINLLEGSVQRYGDQVRVIAQLVRTSDGAHVWSQRFDYKMEDIFALHDAIASAVVAQLKISLLPEDVARIEQGGTDIPAAYDLLMRARAVHEKLFNPSLPDQTPSIDEYLPVQLLSRALEADPDYVDAMISLINIYNLFAFQTTSMEHFGQYIARATPLVERVMELAPTYAAAWDAKGATAHRSGKRDDAIEAFRKAIGLNPNFAKSYLGLAIVSEDPLATLEHMRTFHELDPEETFDRPTIIALTLLGRAEEAVATLESGLRETNRVKSRLGAGLNQMHLDDLANINFWILGRPDESARWGGELIALEPENIRGATALVRAWLAVGDFDRAARWIPKVAEDEGTSDVPKLYRIRLAMARGDLTSASEVLRSLGRPTGMRGGRISLFEAKLCVLKNNLECAQAAVAGFGQALDQAVSQGLPMREWYASQQLLTAIIEARLGESPTQSAQAVIDTTTTMPRTAWMRGATNYMDAEAYLLLGDAQLAIEALEESFLSHDGFIPWDTFSIAADKGIILSQLDGDPRFEDWKTRLRARRTAARERMLAMEAAGEIPSPPG